MKISRERICLIDLGVALTKVGVASDLTPRLVVPTLAACPVSAGDNQTEESAYIFGDAMDHIPGKIKKVPLITAKTILQLRLFRLFLAHLFKLLEFTPDQGYLMIAKPSEWSPELGDQLKRYLLQEFNFEAVKISDSEQFVLETHKTSSAIVLNIGAVETSITPYLNGNVLTNLKMKSPIAGSTITEYFKFLLERQFKYIQSPIFDTFAALS